MVMLRTRRTLTRSVVGVLAALLLATAVIGPGCSDGGAGKNEKTSIRVLYAGSLIIPFGQLEREFEATYPDVDVEMEGHGSIQAVRIVSDLHEEADVVITADYRLIPMLLYEVKDPDSGKPYTDWYAIFATNEMTLAYTEESAFAAEVDAEDWTDIITRPGVRLGTADPRLDANGYRALMMVQLSEDLYDQPELFAEVFGGKFRVPIRVTESGGVTVIKVPEVLETKSGSALVMRPYSVQLLPLLESGDLDYCFEYTSVVKQHGMDYVPLPSEINLSDEALNDYYSKVTVKLDFQRFASVKPEFPGESIRYGATIPSNAGDPEAAATFLAYLLGPEGQRIMAENYQPMIVPALADNLDAIPEAIRALCTASD